MAYCAFFKELLFGCLCNRLLQYLILAFLPNVINADNLYVERIDAEKGLSQNNVASIAQDRKGFMWFGTQTALNRYDGYTFKKYFEDDSNPNSMSNSSTWSLLVDKEGVLWAGTYGGLNRYDESNDNFTIFRNVPNNPYSLSHDTVWSLYEDTEGNLWLGTAKGLNRFDRKSTQFTRFLNEPSNKQSISNDVVNVIYQDTNGKLWVGTDRGLNRYHYDSQNFELIGEASSLFKSATVTAIAEDANGNLWVGTADKGIFILDQSNNLISNKVNIPDKQDSLSTNKIKVILKDGQNRLWIGTDNGGHGFGLHSCANFMTEMGGRLWAESDGLDKGATFIMSFPFNKLKVVDTQEDNFGECKIA